MDSKFIVFKAQCAEYDNYLNQRESVREELDLLQYQINNVRGIAFETVVKQISRSEFSILPKLEIKDYVLLKYVASDQLVRWIENTIYSIPFPAERVMAWQVYILHDRFSKLAGLYSVNGEALRRAVVQHVIGVLTEERMAELDKALVFREKVLSLAVF